jgi:hypothetical protein
MRVRTRSLFLGLALAGASPPARAQTLPSIDAHSWRPSTDPGAGLVLEPTTVPAAWNWNVGAFASYAYQPVTTTVVGPLGLPQTYNPVQHFVGLDLVAGLGIGSKMSLGLSLPTAIYQTGDKPLPSTVSSNGDVPTSGIGDLAINGKASFKDNASGGLGLAGIVTVTVPTGDQANFMGDGAATVSARFLADYTLIVASVQASLGYTVRTNPHDFPDASAGGHSYGQTIPWSLGVSLKPDVFKIDPGHRQRWELAFHGWLPGGPVAPFGGAGAADQSPALATLDDRIDLGHYRDAYVLVGAEVGMNPLAVSDPVVRGIVGIGWAPRNHDMDNDGVPDDVDQCPELPEDRDGFEDNDGCPELDNDDDGVLDHDDACPNVAGFPSPDPKKNGCPQPDADKDGVPDDEDACPNDKGIQSDDPKRNGCPRHADKDKDGVLDHDDKCLDQPEDKDGFEDDDGCPDPDNDGDGIGDAEDACPMVAGEPSSDPKLNGCPTPDNDGDSFDDAVDKCPEEAEVFNGVKDDDGCPDTGGKALVAVETPEKTPRLKLAAPGKLEPGSATLRAVILEMNKHKDWTLLVAAQAPKAADGLTRAAAIAADLDKLAHRNLAEAAEWDAAKKEPLSANGVKFIIVVGASSAKPVAPLPPVPPAAR